MCGQIHKWSYTSEIQHQSGQTQGWLYSRVVKHQSRHNMQFCPLLQRDMGTYFDATGLGKH